MIETSVAYISLIDGDILRIEYKPDCEVGLEQFEENLQAYRQLIGNEKVYLLTVAGPGATTTPEVRRTFASTERSRFKIAEAFVITTLAHRILGSFVVRVLKPVHPILFFSSETEALRWLRELKQKEGVSA